MNIRPALLILALLVVASCNKDDENAAEKPASLKHFEAFKDNSPFYTPIVDNPEIDPNSSVMVTSLEDQADQAFLVAVKEWTTTVFFADETTTTHEVKLTASWAPEKKLLGVPIPDFAEPDPEDDGHMVIVDESGGCIYDFWQAKSTNSGWKASWGNALPLSGDGIFPKGLSARGSGFELLQGMIWPEELEDGVINHALIFSYDHTKSGGPVSPATESDGTTDGAWGIPEGALVQLDPSLDLSALGLNSYEMTIAKCLQEYGMYCADDGGGISLYAIHPSSAKDNPYEDIWGDETYIFLDKIPVERFRVLKMGTQTQSSAVIVSNACAKFD